MRLLLLLTLLVFSCAFPNRKFVAECPQPLELKVLKVETERVGYTTLNLKLKNDSGKPLKVLLRFSIETPKGLEKEIPGFGFSVVSIPPKGEVVEKFEIPYLLEKGELVKVKCFKLNP